VNLSSADRSGCSRLSASNPGARGRSQPPRAAWNQRPRSLQRAAWGTCCFSARNQARRWRPCQLDVETHCCKGACFPGSPRYASLGGTPCLDGDRLLDQAGGTSARITLKQRRELFHPVMPGRPARSRRRRRAKLGFASVDIPTCCCPAREPRNRRDAAGGGASVRSACCADTAAHLHAGPYARPFPQPTAAPAAAPSGRERLDRQPHRRPHRPSPPLRIRRPSLCAPLCRSPPPPAAPMDGDSGRVSGGGVT